MITEGISKALADLRAAGCDADADRLESALTKAEAVAPVASYSAGHCENKKQAGGCQLHNLQCGYPACDRKPIPPAVPVESLGRDADAAAGCVHHDFSILDSYIRNLRWSHDTPNEVRDAVASNLRGLYTHLLTRGLFAGSGSWDAGRLAAAKWIEKRRCAFADEYGLVDPATGVLEFGNGHPERDEYYCELSEIEEAIRALPAPQFVAHTVPDEMTAVYMLGKIDGRRERHPLDEPAVPIESQQADAKDATRFRWLRDHAINTEGRKGSPWCVYGLDLGDCTPTFGAELVAFVDDAMTNGIVCSPVPVESLGRDAPIKSPASVPDGCPQGEVSCDDCGGREFGVYNKSAGVLFCHGCGQFTTLKPTNQEGAAP